MSVNAVLEAAAMGSKERREREKKELRDKILDAARDMFVEEGFEAVTMRSLAKRIEYSPTAIYLHFKDKEHLIAELCREDLGALDAAMASIAERHEPIERMYVVARSYVSFALEHPTQYRLLFMMPKPAGMQRQVGPDGASADPDAQAYANLRRNFVEVIATGAVRADLSDPDLLAQTYFCGIHGIVATAISMGECPLRDWLDPGAQADFFVEAFFNGIAKKRSTTTATNSVTGQKGRP
jgi:AcrR family transcriptional regulator